MNDSRELDQLILARRGPKNHVRSDRPAAYFNESERSAAGIVEPVSTLFLVNRECPFRCLMCDLWKNTLDEPLDPGQIVRQIDYALEHLERANHIKLYNSANFFDPQAIPLEDYDQIVERVNDYQTVIVENHPRMVGSRCHGLARQLGGELEIAMGLETVHPQVLSQLNKRMTVDDYARAAQTLHESGIHTRAFVLLRPPGMDEQAGIEWALKSVQFAIDQGTRVCTIIPTRAGNGMLDEMEADGRFQPPKLRSLETAQRLALCETRGRVFVDLWDAERFSDCPSCTGSRMAAMREMNDTQQPVAEVTCDCEGPA